jgi:hypothetical protein
MTFAASAPWGTTIRGLAGGGVAVSIPLPAQRFYGREPLLRDALLGWAERVERELDGADQQRARSSRARRPGKA